MATELIGIELELRGEEGVYRDLQRLDSLINSIGGRKTINMDVRQSKQRLIELNGELEKLNRWRSARKNAGLDTSDIDKSIKNTKYEIKDVTQRIKELNYAAKNFGGKTFAQQFKTISTSVKHLGQSLQTLGNTFTRIGTPMRTVLQGTLLTAGNKLFGAISEGFQSGFDRYDTIKQYKLMMEEYNTANYNAEQSTKDLIAAVKGMPTGLDEIESLAQRYTLSLGDMKKGTDLAIASNNAFLASMSTESQRYQGMMQMQDLVNGKDLNSNEWKSLGSSMGKAINEIGKEFGYTDKNMGEFRKELYAGNIATQDFLDALVKVGTEGGSIAKIASNAKLTWSAVFSNVGNAFARMGQGILDALDEIAIAKTGRSLPEVLADYMGRIDSVTERMKSWIVNNQDRLLEFVDTIKNIDWAGAAKNFMNGMKLLVGGIEMLSKRGNGLIKIYAWLLPVAAGLGKIFTVIGGLLKGTHWIIGGIGAGGAKALGGKGGLFGRIITLFGTNKTIQQAGEVVGEATTVAPKLSKFSAGLSSVFKGWAEVAAIVGGTAFVGMASIKMLKTSIKDIGEIVDLVKGIDWETGANVLGKFGVFVTSMAAVGATIANTGAGLELLEGTAVAGGITALVSGITALDMKLLKSAAKSLNDTVEYVNNAMNGLKKLKDIENVDSVYDNVANAITVFNKVRDLFQGSSNYATGEMSVGLKGYSMTTTKSMAKIKDTITNLKSAVDALAKLGEMDLDETKVTTTIKKLTPLFEEVGKMLEQIPEGLGTKGTTETTANLDAIMSNLRKSFDSIIGENGILTQIPQMTSAINNMVRSGALEELPKRMKSLGDALRESYNELNSGIGNGEFMSKNMDGIRETLKQAKFAIKHLNEIGGLEVDENGFSNIKALVSGMKSALNADDIAALKEQVDSLVETINTLLEAVKTINVDNNPLTIEITLKSKIKGLDTVTEDIDNIQTKISAAIGRIRTNYNETISVNIGARVNTAGVVNGINNGSQALERLTRNAVNQSTGGYASRHGVLYRNQGGPVFRPRGTDKIPAMLTEGEYVQSRNAVNTFGIDFMRKVNNLDVRGAMQSLLSRTGMSATMNRQTTVNNTVNNNQRVTQNIHTDNPSFARLRVGRYAGAL